MPGSIDQLIVNSPYDEPARHWRYDRESRTFSLVKGRRPPGYVVATPGSKSFDDPGLFVELPLPNRIRPRVKAWREAGYPGVTGITERLLRHWRDTELAETRRFFFCQLQAVETLIWLTEAPAGERQGIKVPGDGGAFSRLCAKMATGSGKTLVMAMVIAWHVLNRVTNPQDKRFSRNVFVVAPGLTVKKRLQVLQPSAEGNFYDLFDMVPGALRERLREGRVLIRNWHALNWETDDQVARKRGVDKRGAKSDLAYVREVLGEMAAASNLLVINDEAHYAWRVAAESKVRGVAKADIEEATKWIGGLDRIHRSRGILACYDFSATPFAPSGKRSEVERAAPRHTAGDDHGRQPHRDGGPGQVRFRPRQDPDRRAGRSGEDTPHRFESAREGRGTRRCRTHGDRWPGGGRRERRSGRWPRSQADPGGAGRAAPHHRRYGGTAGQARGCDPERHFGGDAHRGLGRQDRHPHHGPEGLFEPAPVRAGGRARAASHVLRGGPSDRPVRAQYVNIFGVPFMFLPHEGGDDDVIPPPPPPKSKIEPVPAKTEYEITWPNVIRVEHGYVSRLSLDLEKVPNLDLVATDTPNLADLAPVVEGKPDVTRLTTIDLQALARRFRTQRIVFETASDVFDQMKSGWPGNREVLLAQLVGIIETFMASDRIQIFPQLFMQDPLRRRILLTLNMNRLVRHVWDAIRVENTTSLTPVFDSERPIRGTGDMLPWYTGRPWEYAQRSHINRCVFDSTWEASEASALDRDPNVAAWVKNDHLSFEVIYVFDGVVRRFRPDFLVRLTGGTTLVLEVKGQDSAQNQAKRQFLDEWVRAVNQHGGFGRWAWAVSRLPADVASILAEANRSVA